MSSNAGDTGHAGPTRSSERERHDPRGDRAWNAGGSRAPMFTYDASMADLVLEYSRARLSMDPDQVGIGPSRPPSAAALGDLLCEEGNDPRRVMEIFADEIEPSMIRPDSPSYLAFIPHAPTPASRLFDMLVSSGSLSASHWFESAGAIVAENQALRLLADLAGLPTQAGGCFVTGGSAANLSALSSRPRAPQGTDRRASAAATIRCECRGSRVGRTRAKGDRSRRARGPDRRPSGDRRGPPGGAGRRS